MVKLVKMMNISLVNKFYEEAVKRGINWTFERRQAGKLLWSHAWVRNQTGDEKNTHVQINIDDEANIAYVFIIANQAAVHQEIRDKITDQNGVTEFNPETYGWRCDANHYAVHDKCRFVSNGNIDKWISEIFDHVTECLNVMSNVVY